LAASFLSNSQGLFNFDIPQKLKILDLGCGEGQNSAFLVKAGHQVFGIDLDKKAIKIAKEKGIKARYWDIEKKLPYRGRSFDIILAIDVLEHLFNLEAIIWDISRLLRKNGCFILSVPNHFQIKNRFHIFFGGGIVHWSSSRSVKSWNYSHIRFLRLADLKKLLEMNELYPTKFQFDFSSKFWFLRLIPSGIRRKLVEKFPELFSGKFIILTQKQKPEEVEIISLSEIPKGY
jgi:2-polyprenyl-3-methyl-5-hydroxy-6-metoxy-1,4-benzoquinol methylase